MKKVLIFSTAYIPFIGGAEIAVKNITDRLSSDFEFHMITINLDGKQKRKEQVGAVSVHRICGSGKLAKLLFPFIAYREARKLSKEHSYDVIWSIMASFGGFAALFFKKKNRHIPFILTLQEGDPISEIEHKVRFVKRWFGEIFMYADRVQAISHYLADWAKSKGAKCISVIPNGVDVFWFDPEQTPIESTRENFWKAKNKNISKHQILLTISRLVEKNAIDQVIKALPELQNTHFVILGEGQKRIELERLAETLHVQDRVHFEGLISHSSIIHYLHHSDIFIRPSRSEGMGNSFIEAMAAEVPVIATPVGGIVDFLHDGETGLLCKVDDPKSIAEAVLRYQSDPLLKRIIITNAKRMVKEQYDWNTIAQKMKEEVLLAQ